MLTFDYDLEPAHAPQLGLIALQSDETIERDMARLMPEGVELMVSRVPSGTYVTSESLAAMGGKLQQAASLFPVSARFAAVGYGCTSGSAEIGPDNVARAICDGTETASVTEPVSSLIAACAHLGVRRLGILSPYIESVSARLCAVLEDAGIEITAFGSFNEGEEEKVVRIAPGSIREAALSVGRSAGMDALFISCTNLRTLDVIEGVEADLNLPVLTSNQVLAWHMLSLAGVSAGPAPGRLWAA